jgi:hypothetical protein
MGRRQEAVLGYNHHTDIHRTAADDFITQHILCKRALLPPFDSLCTKEGWMSITMSIGSSTSRRDVLDI